MKKLCPACNRVESVQEHHLAGRVNNVPQSPLSIRIGAECHSILSRWQEERWLGTGLLTPALESWFGWSDLVRLASLRSGRNRVSDKGWGPEYRRVWRQFSGARHPRPLSTTPSDIKVTDSSAGKGLWAGEMLSGSFSCVARAWLLIMGRLYHEASASMSGAHAEPISPLRTDDWAHDSWVMLIDDAEVPERRSYEDSRP